MKLIRLEIKNIGLVKDETIEINKHLTLFFGDIKQGKTTRLNCVKWVLGGIFPDDIISHGEESGSIKMVLDDGYIKREFYRGKNGTTARKIEAIIKGELQSKPTEYIKQMVNPFLLDQDYFIKMSSLEKKRYLFDILGLDFSAQNKELQMREKEASELRSKINFYGDIQLDPCEEVDIQKIRDEMQEALNNHKYESDKIKDLSKIIETHNRLYDEKKSMVSRIRLQIAELEKQMNELSTWLIVNEHKPLIEDIPSPDLTEFNARIDAAQEHNYKYKQYKEAEKKQREKENDERRLQQIELGIVKLRKQKIDMLKTSNDQVKIEGLSFDENSNIVFDGTMIDMMSNSQMMTLSSYLRSLYNNELAIELIDRGESLGKSIYGFIDKAKKDQLTILATIVGEKPAKIDDEIGVYVVENGKVKIK